MRASLLAVCLVTASSLLLQPLDAQRSRARKDDPNRLICQTSVKTGTLAGRERKCFTRQQWERLSQSGREGAEKMIDRLRGGFNCASAPSTMSEPPNPGC